MADQPHLFELVHRRRVELGLSLRQVEDRTINAGSGEPIVRKSWLDRLEKRAGVKAPSPLMLRALSRALELPLVKVQEAAGLEFFELEPRRSTDGEVRALVAHWEEMSTSERAELTRVLDQFAQRRRDRKK
ncbi:XRE family transcriptional regulator [Streptomyces alkaliterrae]|uniref:XRE family transcriptional regulator n=1 Tax=Streptomyces alkaliterrae TaxID=2213162 RepID=A0A5P0YJ84_9ACTN|nr:XRE family transcriptional regulator [Streptomyces alkaliterrae]MBB1251864.1 XRE family transcriptional regulator [Streptomyces alkaliterrae]MBB1259323.1 XRE family transcriptional regulator [Streptomyces alkaliterrae]MQS00298.1 XRE family transcriptional regulator [Streptomyces alkaliterrae]